jgi:hypothetical protein
MYPKRRSFPIFHNRYEAIPEYVKLGMPIGEPPKIKEKQIPPTQSPTNSWEGKEDPRIEAALPAVISDSSLLGQSLFQIDTAAEEKQNILSQLQTENQPSSSPLIENKSIATPTPHPTTPLRRRRRLLPQLLPLLFNLLHTILRLRAHTNKLRLLLMDLLLALFLFRRRDVSVRRATCGK